MENLKFFVCEHCGNIITFVKDQGVPVMCCGQEMTEITANTTDAAQDKHVPLVSAEGNEIRVSVGSVEHPMTAEHSIEWICIRTKDGFQIKYLDPDKKPEAVFHAAEDEVEAVLAYCNLHGLWKA